MDSENLTYHFYSYENPCLKSLKLKPENPDMEVFPLYVSE